MNITAPNLLNMAAPLFELATDSGAVFNLGAMKGKRVVLYFYPKDDTPGCTTEAKDFSDAIDDFTKENTVIIGISKDSVQSHNKFKTKYCLLFMLVSDQDGVVCNAYGTWVEKSMYGKKYWGIERCTYLIDEHGVIRNIWRKVSVTNHVKEVLEAVKSIK